MAEPTIFYKEYPEAQARVREILSKVQPGAVERMDMDLWRKAFTRMSGPYDAIFGPSETPMQVFVREWGHVLEFRQITHGEVDLAHWLVPDTRTERRMIIPRQNASVDFECHSSMTETYETEEFQLTVLRDRRTGRLVDE